MKIPDCLGCQLQRRISPSDFSDEWDPPSEVGGPHRVGPSELQPNCANCLTTLDHESSSHDFNVNEMFEHSICYSGMETEVDVKPPKEEHPPKISIVSLKDRTLLKEIEQVEDCFILEFDPYESVTDFPSLSTLLFYHDADLAIVAEQGEIACRDYPHSRHLCATHPFDSSPHYMHCNKCYCYVCDAPAPCEQWNRPSSHFKHCEATPDIQIWRDLRNAKKRKFDAYFDEIASQFELCNEIEHIGTSQSSH